MLGRHVGSLKLSESLVIRLYKYSDNLITRDSHPQSEVAMSPNRFLRTTNFSYPRLPKSMPLSGNCIWSPRRDSFMLHPSDHEHIIQRETERDRERLMGVYLFGFGSIGGDMKIPKGQLTGSCTPPSNPWYMNLDI
jgi:hypothetical protein